MTPDEAPESGTQRLALGCFYAGSLTMTWLTFRLAGESLTVSDGFLGLSVAFALLGGRPGGRRGILALAGLLIAVAVLLAGFRADGLSAHLLLGGRVLIIVTVLPWLAWTVVRTVSQLQRAMALWAIGAAVSGLVAIVQTGTPIFVPAEYLEAGRMLGLARHPTDAGGMLSIALPAALGLTILAPARRKVLWVGASGLIGVGMVLAASVSAFIAATVGVVALALGLRASGRVLVGTAIGSVLVTYYATSQQVQGLALSPSERLTATTSGQYDTASTRLDTIQFAWDRVWESPVVGRGLDGSSGETVLQLATHNTPLLLWFQGGLLMLFGVGVFLAYVTRHALKGPCANHRAILASSFVAALTFSLTSPLLVQRYLWFPALLLLSGAMAIKSIGPRPKGALALTGAGQAGR